MRNIEYSDICCTWRCSLRCPTCGSFKRDQEMELSVKQIDHICESFPNLKDIVLEGGSPFLWKNLFYFCDKMKKDGRNIAIITNGVAEARIKKWIDTFGAYTKNFSFNVSLNGIGEIHDISRGVKGVYEKTLRSAIALRQAGFPVSFSFVPFAENVDHYVLVRDLAKKHDIGVGICYPCESAKFGENMFWHYIPKESVHEIRRNVLNQRKLPKNPRRWFRYFMAGWINDYFDSSVLKKKVMPCDAGKEMMHINPDGTIRPCCFDESMEIGKVTDEGVIWTGLLKKHKKRIPNKCQYAQGDVCNACFIGYTLWSRPFRILWWRIKEVVKWQS